MITVHHLENSRSQRVLWLLEELEVDYTVKRYARDPATSLAPPELKAVHPLGKSPLIDDDGIVVAESGNIVEYLCERFPGPLAPAVGTAEHRWYRYWLHYAEGTLAPLLVMTLIFNRIETAPMPFIVRPIAKGISGKVKKSYLEPNLSANLAYLDAHLGENAWFTGDQFTAADIMMSFGLEAAASRGAKFQRYSHLAKMLKTMQARPAYQRALERGGPYSLLS
ncbi:MAG: glutathione S-transferase [Oceanococcaceae bacterium]